MFQEISQMLQEISQMFQEISQNVPGTPKRSKTSLKMFQDNTQKCSRISLKDYQDIIQGDPGKRSKMLQEITQ